MKAGNETISNSVTNNNPFASTSNASMSLKDNRFGNLNGQSLSSSLFAASSAQSAIGFPITSIQRFNSSSSSSSSTSSSFASAFAASSTASVSNENSIHKRITSLCRSTSSSSSLTSNGNSIFPSSISRDPDSKDTLLLNSNPRKRARLSRFEIDNTNATLSTNLIIKKKIISSIDWTLKRFTRFESARSFEWVTGGNDKHEDNDYCDDEDNGDRYELGKGYENNKKAMLQRKEFGASHFEWSSDTIRFLTYGVKQGNSSDLLFYSRLSYIYPDSILPQSAMKLLSRNLKPNQSSGTFGVNNDTRESISNEVQFLLQRKHDWIKSFCSLYQAFRCGIEIDGKNNDKVLTSSCPYFYCILESEFAVLFLNGNALSLLVEEEEEKKMIKSLGIVAIISHATTAMRSEWMLARIPFEIPLNPSVKTTEVNISTNNPEVIEEFRKYEMESRNSSIIANPALTRMTSYSSASRGNFAISTNSQQHKESLRDAQSELVTFHGEKNCAQFHSWLLEKIRNPSFMSLSDVPQLISPTPFVGASIKIAKLELPTQATKSVQTNENSIGVMKETGFSVSFNGYILPTLYQTLHNNLKKRHHLFHSYDGAETEFPLDEETIVDRSHNEDFANKDDDGVIIDNKFDIFEPLTSQFTAAINELLNSSSTS